MSRVIKICSETEHVFCQHIGKNVIIEKYYQTRPGDPTEYPHRDCDFGGASGCNMEGKCSYTEVKSIWPRKQ